MSLNCDYKQHYGIVLANIKDANKTFLSLKIRLFNGASLSLYVFASSQKVEHGAYYRVPVNFDLNLILHVC
jgi:hypothetical protein